MFELQKESQEWSERMFEEQSRRDTEMMSSVAASFTTSIQSVATTFMSGFERILAAQGSSAVPYHHGPYPAPYPATYHAPYPAAYPTPPYSASHASMQPQTTPRSNSGQNQNNSLEEYD